MAGPSSRPAGIYREDLMQLVKLIRGAVAAIASVTLSACCLLGADASTALAWSPPAPVASSVVKTTNVPVTMSDGTVLYVDIVRPADSSGNALPGPYPVLLTQTPYNKNGALSFEDDYLVEHGYVQVIADVRGTGSSEGTWDSFGAREQQDGYELAEWTRTQPWSTGSIGLPGTSYSAINQFLTAELQPRGAKTAFPLSRIS